MRFLPSNPGRTVAEVLLTVAIVAFVVYDLSGHSSVKPEASSNVVLSFEAKRPSAIPAVDASSSSSRFETAVTGITAVNTFTVCGNTVPPTNPWIIGNGTNQALIIQLGGGCISNPSISNRSTVNGVNTTIMVGITINAGSWLSFQNIHRTGDNAGASSGPLIMYAGSYFETILAAGLQWNPEATLVFPLLLAAGACPTFAGVTILTTTNCPYDASLALTGAYQCVVSSANILLGGGSYCSILLTVVGALSQASAPITFTFNKDCSSYTVASFKASIFSTTGISALAIDVAVWQCSSITATFTILGSNPALIAAAVASLLAAAAPGGALYNALGGIIIGGVVVPTTTVTRGYYPTPYCRYYPCNPTLPFNYSSSNPGLFALLTLLVIPVAIFVALLIYVCLPRAPVCEPVPVCPPAPVCPAPAPVVYYAEPCAMPCPCPDPCAAPIAPACF